jgi:hypothetical protein
VKEVDYARLSEQYAGFLVAVGGVSITALALVLGLNTSPDDPVDKLIAATPRLFLVASLIVATVSCFIGAHMMAETAAFFTHPSIKNSEETSGKIKLGHRLFVLATTKIFIAVTLVLFAMVLLPTATGKKLEITDNIKPILSVIFVAIVIGALFWMALAAIDRTDVGPEGWYAMVCAILVGAARLFFSCDASNQCLLLTTFIVIVSFNALSLVYFAAMFKEGVNCGKLHCLMEVAVSSSVITFTYASLAIVYCKIL